MKVEWHQNLLGNLWVIQMMRGSKNRKESVYIQMTKNHNWFWINQKKSTFAELLEATIKLNNVFKILEEDNFKAKMLCPAKLSIICENGFFKTFSNMQGLNIFF